MKTHMVIGIYHFTSWGSCMFILGKHVNYFDILEFQGVGRGMPHNKEHARADPNRVRPPPHPWNPPCLYPASSSVFDKIEDALLQLSQTLLRHSTYIQGHGVASSSRGEASTNGHARGEPSQDAQPTDTGHPPIPHICTSCGSMCCGSSAQYHSSGFYSFVSPPRFHIFIVHVISIVEFYLM